MYAAVTYFPELDAFIAGDHMFKPDNWGSLEMRSVEIESMGTVNFDARCANHGMMELVKTYCRVKKHQQDRLYLDYMFDDPCLDKPGSDWHDKILFDSQNASDSCDVPFDMINSKPGSENFALDVDNALLRKREHKAQVALQRLGYHYQKDGDGKRKFRRTTAPADNCVQRISKPVYRDIYENVPSCVWLKLGKKISIPTYRSIYDNKKTRGEILECCAAFKDMFERPITSIACSTIIAANLTNGTSVDEKIKSAAGTIGTTCEFPDMKGVRMVASAMCPNNVIYAASKHALLKYEGPKIIRQSQPKSQTVCDSNLYRCAHEDPSEDRTLGFIIDLQTCKRPAR